MTLRILPISTLLLVASTAWPGGTDAPELAKTKALAQGRSAALFGVLHKGISKPEREALEFLFAGSPLSDLADFDGDYFLQAVRASLEARRRTAWGPGLPEDVFRHFVLPPRVNNEHMDAFRTRYFRELLERVKRMPMAQAALEINHWCHEKATYQGTDSRTASPLSTISSAFGRCGEESTFVVAAMRAACIPARQVYTPRWAHSDDNHAWVEVWVDGRWHFLGACEPDPELDMGWFKEPARRAMLIHTRAFGPYRGGEPVVRSGDRFAELNLTGLYAPVKAVPVQVVDPDGRPVADAAVDYQIYNYGEFSTLATQKTGPDGRVKLATGLGDLLLWARKGNRFGFQKITVEAVDAVKLTLNGDPAKEQVLELDQVPPVERPSLPESRASREENNRRMKEEDALRARYTATFMNREQARALASELGLDGERVWKAISKSAGNWKGIETFLRATDAGERPWALPLLESVSDKDLRDTPADVLRDHLRHGLAEANRVPAGDFVPHLLCPRVDNELLTPFRGYLQERLPKALAVKWARNPALLVAWIRTHIRIDDAANHYRVPLSPRGVFELKVADVHSRDIFFVAACRSLGIPARLEPALRRPQYWQGGTWVDAAFTALPGKPKEAVGTLIPVSEDANLKYGIHFTLARFQEGRYQTLELDDEQPISQFAKGLELPVGHYRVVTGNRIAGGTVLARMECFNLGAGETRRLPIVFRKSEMGLKSLGRLDASASLSIEGKTKGVLELAKEKGAILIWAGPGQEPTRHVMGDVRGLKEALEKWGGTLAFLLPEGAEPAKLGPDFQQLPTQALCLGDPGSTLLKQIAKATGRDLGANLPVIAVVDRAGNIVHLSEGYQIGAGELTLKTVLRVSEQKK